MKRSMDDIHYRLAHHINGIDIYADKQNAYFVKKGGIYFRLSIPPTTLEPPNPKRENIIVLYEEKDGKYYNAAPWSIFTTFKLANHKIRGYLKDDGHYYILTIKIDGKQKKRLKISASKILHCTEGSWYYEDSIYYITMEHVQIFVHEWTNLFAHKYLKLPMQLNLPFYQKPTKPILPEFKHPSLELLQ